MFIFCLLSTKTPQEISRETVLNLIDDLRLDVYNGLGLRLLEPTMSPLLLQTTFRTYFDTRWGAIPIEPGPQVVSRTAGTQCLSPGSHILVPTPDTPFSVRCAAHTSTNGLRCRRPAFYPYTL